MDQKNQVINQSVLEARAKLAEKFKDQGEQRRKKKIVHKTTVTDDKKLKTIIKKYGVQPFQGIEEVNMFKDDKTILHFDKPEVLTSLQNNTFVVIGKGETKTPKELMPGILPQFGPKQMELLQDILKEGNLGAKRPDNTITEQPGEDDEIPDLKQNFEEIAKVD